MSDDRIAGLRERLDEAYTLHFTSQCTVPYKHHWVRACPTVAAAVALLADADALAQQMADAVRRDLELPVRGGIVRDMICGCGASSIDYCTNRCALRGALRAYDAALAARAGGEA